ncbi:MAG: hypothetical protein ABIG65_02500, partial [Patescibacteria group bacterium]
TRIKIMWVGAILGSLVIFSFWLWSTAILLAQSPKTNKENDKAFESLNEIKKKVPGLWQSLSAGIGNVIDTAKEELNSSPSVTPQASEVEPSATERLPIEQ